MTPELAITCFYHPSLFHIPSYSFRIFSWFYRHRSWSYENCGHAHPLNKASWIASQTFILRNDMHFFGMSLFISCWSVFAGLLRRWHIFLNPAALIEKPDLTQSLVALVSKAFNTILTQWIDTRRAQQRHGHTAWAPEHAKKFSSSPRSRNNPKIGLEKRRSYTTDSTGIVGHRCFGSLALRCHWGFPKPWREKAIELTQLGCQKKIRLSMAMFI